MNQNSEDNQDVPSVSIEQPESVPFPSLSQTAQQLETSATPLTTTSPAAASVVDIDSVHMLPLPEELTNQLVSPALMRFKLSLEAFVDSLMREWKTLNVVSALLLSAILTMFQVPDMATDPLTRTAALLSLICAIMSLSYGCMYIVRFGTMRSMCRASRWAETSPTPYQEAQKTKTLLWWNVWILLAMPAVWMSWSMIFFISSIISYVWRTGSILDPQEREGLSPKAVLGPRIAITGLFVLGMGYFVLIVKTLKAYGDDEKGRRVGVGGGGSGGAVHGRGTYPSHDHGTHRPGVEDINMNSIWERRGRERERSTTSRRGRRSVSLTRSPRRKSHNDHGQRMDFRERVNSLGHSQGHHYRKLFGLGFMGVGVGDGRVHDDGPGSSVSGVDGVDLEKGCQAIMDNEDPSPKRILRRDCVVRDMDKARMTDGRRKAYWVSSGESKITEDRARMRYLG
ncbi:hypothetical protein VKT23_009491 [Stygiomarasmius scandens]|uniref:Uncharacterized protein n=1 Tax=Marasmiellus scandens TaxID=2682957 RepID=A0ABR1JEJ4_9AGAR